MLRSLGRLSDQQGRNARFFTDTETAVRLCSFWCAGYPVRRRAAAHHECAWPPTVRVARARRRAQCVRHSFAATSVCQSPSNSPPVTRGDCTYGPSSYVQLSTEGLRSWRGAGQPALAGALVALLPRRSRATGLRVPNHSGSGRVAAGGLVITTATAARSAAWQTTARPLHRSAAWQRRAEWPTEPASCDAPTRTRTRKTHTRMPHTRTHTHAPALPRRPPIARHQSRDAYSCPCYRALQGS